MPADTETPPEPAARSWWALPASVWGGIAVVLFAVQARASGALDDGWTWTGSRLFGGWVQFDGPEYLSIAAKGYERRQLVWFPLYPLAIRALDAVTGSPIVVAVAISAIGGAAAVVLYWRWLGNRDRGLSRASQLTAFAVMAVYPYAWFLYGVVYADAVFTAFVIGAFLLAERDRYVAAGLLAALATATRPSGTAVVAGLFVLALERSGVLAADPIERGDWAARLRLPRRLDRSKLSWRACGPLLGFAGVGAYAAWQWAAWGSPIRFVTEEANYHDTGDATFLKRQYFEAWYQGFDGRHLATTTGQAVLLLIVLISVPAVGRRFGWGYGAYVFLLALFPAYTVSTFMGVGRYLLPAFPCFALAGTWLAERKRVRIGWLVASAALLGIMSFGYSRGWYLT